MKSVPVTVDVLVEMDVPLTVQAYKNDTLSRSASVADPGLQVNVEVSTAPVVGVSDTLERIGALF